MTFFNRSDNTVLLQAKCNGGGKVEIPSGEFHVSETIKVLESGTHIVGEGSGVTRIVARGLEAPVFEFGSVYTEPTDQSIKDLSIELGSSGDVGIYKLSSRFWTCRDVSIEGLGSGQVGLYMENGAHNRIDNVRSNGPEIGFLLDISGGPKGYGNPNLINTLMTACWSSAVGVDSAADFEFRGFGSLDNLVNITLDSPYAEGQGVGFRGIGSMRLAIINPGIDGPDIPFWFDLDNPGTIIMPNGPDTIAEIRALSGLKNTTVLSRRAAQIAGEVKVTEGLQIANGVAVKRWVGAIRDWEDLIVPEDTREESFGVPNADPGGPFMVGGSPGFEFTARCESQGIVIVQATNLGGLARAPGTIMIFGVQI